MPRKFLFPIGVLRIMPASINAIVDAYNPQDTREAAHIAKAADMDIAARVWCAG